MNLDKEAKTVRKIDHVGIVVKDLEYSLKKYTSHLGLELKEVEEVEVENAINKLAFLAIGETNFDLIQTAAEPKEYAWRKHRSSL